MTWTRGGNSRTSTPAHRRWRRAVLTRDNYQCQTCGYQGHPGDGIMQADHIHNVKQGGAEHDIANGRAICINCHKPKTQAEAAAGRRLKSRRRPPEPHPALTQPRRPNTTPGGTTPTPPPNGPRTA